MGPIKIQAIVELLRPRKCPRTALRYPQLHIKFFWEVPTSHQSDEEGSSPQMGTVMPIISSKYKTYISRPAFLTNPIKGKPLVIRIAALDVSLGSLFSPGKC